MCQGQDRINHLQATTFIVVFHDVLFKMVKMTAFISSVRDNEQCHDLGHHLKKPGLDPTAVLQQINKI